MTNPRRVGFFGASGAESGSGIHNALEWWRGGKLPSVDPAVIISCNPSGGVARVASKFGLPFCHFAKPHDEAAWQRLWREGEFEFLVLLGCSILVRGLQCKTGFMINEHPALLSIKDTQTGKPRFGGKGMTDMKVHEAVVAARQTLGVEAVPQSGTTTHFVVCTTGTEADYDAGNLIINEHRIAIFKNETALSLQNRVKALQRQRTPLDIERVASGQIYLSGNSPATWRVGNMEVVRG